MYLFTNDNDAFHSTAWTTHETLVIDEDNHFAVCNDAEFLGELHSAVNITHVKISLTNNESFLDLAVLPVDVKKVFVHGHLKKIQGAHLANLETLCVQNNHLTSVGSLLFDEDGQLYYPKLKELIISGNNITKIPLAMIFYNLDYLDLSRNPNLSKGICVPVNKELRL